ncbi:UbiA family prenyltransferase [Aquilutibacter rugosus]|uniref:UbiA family prenyltransferase n=1 Tax=Aquilutibacter rugosus TaxID=3115820 RepID=UPI002F422898
MKFDETNRALAVDLDGTLVHTDLLYESFLSAFKSNPLVVFSCLLWVLKGKSYLKGKLAERANVDVSVLPYNQAVLDYIRSSDQHVVLATATDARIANQIGDHLEIFDDVHGTDTIGNLSGSRKTERLNSLFGKGGYDYIGNDFVDIPVWNDSARAIVANAPASLQKKMKASHPDVVVLESPARNRIKTWVKGLRIHQWLKNLLIFVPLIASHQVLNSEKLLDTVLAFIAFGCLASGVYVLNDLLDLDSDRRHPRKCKRPFASGAIPVLHGLVAAPLLTIIGFGIAISISKFFLAVLVSYYIITLAYSFRLKKVVMVDVLLLASLYTIRIVAGAAAIRTIPSFWLLAFSMFIFLSLALVKRYAELHDASVSGKEKASGRGYAVSDLPLLQSLGASAGYLSVLVLAMYINSTEAIALYSRPIVLWMLCPVLLFWVSRLWIITHRGDMHDDPIVFAAKDKVSLIVVVLFGAILLAAI